jgi:hypothetical protein
MFEVLKAQESIDYRQMKGTVVFNKNAFTKAGNG